MAIDIFAGSAGPGFDTITSDDVDVLRINAQLAPSVRDAESLAAKIKNAKGKLTVNANSSDLIVALNNRLRFSITRNAVGDYEITDRLGVGSSALLLIVGGISLVLILLASSRR